MTRNRESPHNQILGQKINACEDGGIL